MVGARLPPVGSGVFLSTDRAHTPHTLVGTLRKELGEDFVADYRADAKLGTVLKKEGAESLRQLIEKPK